MLVYCLDRIALYTSCTVKPITRTNDVRSTNSLARSTRSLAHNKGNGEWLGRVLVSQHGRLSDVMANMAAGSRMVPASALAYSRYYYLRMLVATRQLGYVALIPVTARSIVHCSPMLAHAGAYHTAYSLGWLNWSPVLSS